MWVLKMAERSLLPRLQVLPGGCELKTRIFFGFKTGAFPLLQIHVHPTERVKPELAQLTGED